MLKYVENLISLWRETDSMDTFLPNLSKIGEVDPYTFCFLVFLSSEDSIASLNERLHFSFGSKVEEEKPNSALYYLSTYVGKEQEKIEGRVILFQERSGISFLFTVSTRDFIDKCLLRFLAHSYPAVFQPVLKQGNLREILTEVEKNLLPNAVRVIKSSAKRWVVSEGPGGKKKRICSRLDWENMSVKDAFRESAEEDKWFTKLTFRVYIQKEYYLQDNGWESSLSKRGMFLTNRWLEQYSKVVIPQLHSIAQEKVNLYKNRSRAETESYEINPLAIKFKESIFDDKENNNRLISSLKKIPHFGYSVIHANPYIHMSLLDYKDGSSFEILVHEPDKIVILPQIRTSSISLERVIGHIAEEFMEGKVEDMKKSQYE